MKDFMGRPITVGHILCYPVRRKSDLTMHACRVVWADDAGIHGDRLSDGRQVTLRPSSASRCVVVPEGEPCN